MYVCMHVCIYVSVNACMYVRNQINTQSIEATRPSIPPSSPFGCIWGEFRVKVEGLGFGVWGLGFRV